MKHTKLIATMALATICAIPGNADNGFRVMNLGPTNSVVKIDSVTNYILLPVEESVPDAKIDILVNGKIAETINVRLASNKVDYKVPFELTPYTSQGKVALNINAPDDRTYLRNAGDNLLWSELELSDTFDDSNREKYRPLFHHSPKWGWMNDPNGMFYKDGVWHLNFQHNPYGSKWNNLSWGHATSTDLVHWEAQPETLRPDGLGMIFSGSAVVDSLNTAGFGKDAIIAIYTSAATNQVQSLAYSTDGGMTFTTYQDNPIISTDREARDPNMFWHEESGKWILLIAHALDHEMLIYSSPDLKNWTYESSFGKGYAAQGGVWECPDLFKLPVKGTDKEKWVLICNINPGGPYGGSAAQYFIGDFDGKTFTPDRGPEVTKWMDYGKDHYAAVTFSNAPDNRHTTIAWMSNWEYANEVPTMQFRSANALPRDHELFVAPDGEIYLASVPAVEMEAMRGAKSHSGSKDLSQKPAVYALPTANDGICEIVVDFDEVNAKEVVFTLSNAKGEEVEMVYNVAASTFSMDRTRSGITSFSDHFLSKTTAPTYQAGKELQLRLFIDRSSIEAFDGEGRFAMTNLVFPTEPYTKLSIKTLGGRAKVKSVDIYEINI